MGKRKKGMKPVQVFLPEEVLKKAKERAKELGISTSELLREIIIGSLKYGILIPGEGEFPLKVRITDEDLEKIKEAVKEALGRREKKGIWKKISEWFR